MQSEKELYKQASAWNLVDFLQAVVEAAQEGYVLDCEDNLHHPQMIGTFFTATMKLKEVPAVVVEKTDESTEAVVGKPGRKAKVKSEE